LSRTAATTGITTGCAPTLRRFTRMIINRLYLCA
jgi:hypothetical protein